MGLIEKRGFRAVLATAMVAAFAFLALLISPAAFAESGDVAVPNSDDGGTLTIAKTDQDQNPLAGVVFKACPILKDSKAADLTDSATWADFNAFDGNVKEGLQDKGYTVSEDCLTTDATDAKGEATLEHLSGAYLLVETTKPANVADATVPFIITMPFPNYNDGKTVTAWSWNVTATPKNVVAGTPTKTTDDSQAHVAGDTITWDITVPVPDTTVKTFKVVDNFDSKLESPALVKVTVGGVDKTSEFTASAVDNELTVTANDPASLKGQTVVVTVSAKVKDAGAIPNTAEVFVNDSHQKVTTEGESKWGEINVLKFKKGDETAVLAGAKFDLYLAKDETSNELGVKLLGDLTTNDKGTLDKDLVVKAGRYCFVETQAPEGYVLDKTPKCTNVAERTPTTGVAVVKVPNTQVVGPHLPKTGANGTILLTVAGLAVLLMAGGTAVVSKRRNR
ncbi:MAG: SpaH/EbpB family LPXTG-anchored major pilin [Actinomycetaceae bacterium]|nr:SpaH/EbpB family LPXTG-anchored major pilin [Actinomycetaceae bacterium]MDU0970894.1 SpaH/EbpB family LPXTG-anchored major pilin [Actinomycetaceae bacterium]